MNFPAAPVIGLEFMTDCGNGGSMKCAAAVALGKMGRGVPRKLSPKEIKRRTVQIIAARRAAIARKAAE